jgi:hypothetical protein
MYLINFELLKIILKHLTIWTIQPSFEPSDQQVKRQIKII